MFSRHTFESIRFKGSKSNELNGDYESWGINHPHLAYVVGGIGG